MASSTRNQENDEGTVYSSRHEHSICLYEGLQPYTCTGCKEKGANFGYKCHLCPEVIMHEACAVIPDEYVHPIYRNYPLHFRRKTHLRHHCDGCGGVVRGFVFESPSRDLRLHPLCMALPRIVSYGGHKEHRLKLVVDQKEKFKCTQCDNTNSCWRFQCENTGCRLWIDLNCVKVDFHGLLDVGISSIVRRSRSRRFLEILSKSGIFLVGSVIEGAVGGLVGASLN